MGMWARTAERGMRRPECLDMNVESVRVVVAPSGRMRASRTSGSEREAISKASRPTAEDEQMGDYREVQGR